MNEKRRCLKCCKDLADIMGCYVFTVDRNGKLASVPGLVCVEHGANGANVLDADDYRRRYAALLGSDDR